MTEPRQDEQLNKHRAMERPLGTKRTDKERIVALIKETERLKKRCTSLRTERDYLRKTFAAQPSKKP